MYSVNPAASLPTPLTTLQYGVVDVPGPESEQFDAVRSTYRAVVAARATSGHPSAAPDSKDATPTLTASLMALRVTAGGAGAHRAFGVAGSAVRARTAAYVV